MMSRGHFVLLLIAAVSILNLCEAAPVDLTLARLNNEASNGTFKVAWEASDTNYASITSREECGQYLDNDIINKAELKMIIAYSFYNVDNDSQFNKDLNKELRENGIGSSKYSTAIAVLLEALRKLGNYQRNAGDVRHNGPLYRSERREDVKDIYTDNSNGNLNQFTATFTVPQTAEKFAGTFGAHYLTTFKNPPSGAYVGECSFVQSGSERRELAIEFLLPIGLAYKVEEVNEDTAILNLHTNITTPTSSTTITARSTTTITARTTNTATSKDTCNNGCAICLPANTELLTRDGGVKYIEDVEIGDEVQVISPDGSVGYSEVWCHGHYDLNSTNTYLEITTRSHVLPISHRHYLPVAANSTIMYKMAQDVQIGDYLLTLGDGNEQSLEMVKYVKEIESRGAFAPVTKSGEIIVNGIRVSCYSEVYPPLAHVLLTPLRIAYDIIPKAIMDFVLSYKSQAVPYVTGIARLYSESIGLTWLYSI